MPSHVPEPNHSPRVGHFQSLAAIVGCDPDGAPKRLTLKGNYEEPRLPFRTRMQWLAKVQRLIAESSEQRESYPHKLAAVARVLAYVGDVCRPSLDYVAAQAGCVPNTAKACIAWLEAHGALTWHHTARRHRSGRMVRGANLYRLLPDFRGFAGVVARTMRAIWRARPTVTAPKRNGCPGLSEERYFIEPFEARQRLAEIGRRRTETLNRSWQQRHAT